MLALLILSLIFLAVITFVFVIVVINEVMDYTKVPMWIENTCEFIYNLF